MATADDREDLGKGGERALGLCRRVRKIWFFSGWSGSGKQP